MGSKTRHFAVDKVGRILIFLPVLLAMSPRGSAYAQLNILKRVFEPQVFQVTDELRDYIRGTEFPEVSRDRNEELSHIDMLFAKGMELSNDKMSTALLAISFAVLNRTYIEPTFPLVGIIRLPLPADDSSRAVSRIRKLPRYFFNDSPRDRWGDSAKLVHFFGSAYLTYETGTKKIPDAIGIWVEEGEVAFKLDSIAQQRDVFIDRLGQEFGDALRRGREVLPSDFLKAEILRTQIKKIDL
jgi:hypothetical protein